MISYYELLGMIKEGKAPNKLKLYQVGTFKVYIKVEDIDDTCWYVLENDDDCDDNYRTYLSECLLEGEMFRKNIEILDGKIIPEKLEEYKMTYPDGALREDEAGEQIELLTKKINEIIDVLNSKGE